MNKTNKIRTLLLRIAGDDLEVNILQNNTFNILALATTDGVTIASSNSLREETMLNKTCHTFHHSVMLAWCAASALLEAAAKQRTRALLACVVLPLTSTAISLYFNDAVPAWPTTQLLQGV